MGEKDIKNIMGERERILRMGISFKFIRENCRTISDLKNYHNKVLFMQAESQTDKNISKIINPQEVEDRHHKVQREILRSVFGE